MSRNCQNCLVFGKSKDLSLNVLPTIEDTMKYYSYLLETNNMAAQNRNFNPTVNIAKKVASIWKRASIPTVSEKRIVDLIVKLQKKRSLLTKSFKRDEKKDSFQKKLKSFQNNAKVLLDVASCKCKSQICLCDKEKKVPINERNFLLDQRTVRKQMIGGIDHKFTLKFNKCISRNLINKIEKIEPVANNSEAETSLSNTNGEVVDTESNGVQMNDNVSSQSFNTLKVNTLAKVLDRYGVSNRVGAAIASATLIDAGVVTVVDNKNLIDKNKLQRARQKERNLRMNDTIEDVISIYFDGRKDKTLNFTEGKLHHIVEEHVVVIVEPNSQYFGHVSPSSSSAANILISITNLFARRLMSMNNIRVVGCDGTVTNTGNRGGVITLLEAHISSPVQWFICQLHSNELPLRHLIIHLDGTTQGPKAFNGPIGKQLSGVTSLPVVDFMIIDSDLPIILKSDLSSDQMYLYDMVVAISNGRCSTALLNREPGAMVHSRWLTTANRILRLYVATLQPHPHLIILANYIVKVYAPMWFEIKLNSSCFSGAQHLHKTIKLSRYLPDNLKSVIDPVLQRNGYFGHTENVLLAMLADDNNNIRKLAYHRICKIREKFLYPEPIRKFCLQSLKMNSINYWDMVDWHDSNIIYTEPPILMKYSNNQLQEMVLDHKNALIFKELEHFPCHTQSVERAVKLVTESSLKVSDEVKRDGVIRNTLLSRKCMPTCDSKSHLLCLIDK